MAGYGSDEGFAVWATVAGHVVPGGANVAAARHRGSVYIDGMYGPRFTGSPVGGSSQEREWPRTGATDRYGNALPSDEIPQRVVDAAYEAAWTELQSPGALARVYTPGERKVLTEVKGIKWTVIDEGTGADIGMPRSTAIDGILAPLLVQADVPAVLVV